MQQEEDTAFTVREEIEEFIFNENNKINKATTMFILRRFRKLEAMVYSAELKRMEAEAISRGLLIQRPGKKRGMHRTKTLLRRPRLGRKLCKPMGPEGASRLPCRRQKSGLGGDQESVKGNPGT